MTTTWLCKSVKAIRAKTRSKRRQVIMMTCGRSSGKCMAAISLLLWILLAGCTTTPTGNRKSNGLFKPASIEVQKKVVGIPIGREWVQEPTTADETKGELKAPAKLVMWVAGVIAVISFAANMVVQDIVISKLLGKVSLASGAATGAAAVWLVAANYWFITIPLLVIGVAIHYLVMKKAEGKGILGKKKKALDKWPV